MGIYSLTKTFKCTNKCWEQQTTNNFLHSIAKIMMSTCQSNPFFISFRRNTVYIRQDIKCLALNSVLAGNMAAAVNGRWKKLMMNLDRIRL